MVKKIAVLTSGGDAPGMNACVRAVVRAALKYNLEVFVIYEGYKGLIEKQIVQADRNFVSEIINRGGTILHSARLPEFKELEVQKKAVEVLNEFGIDGLITIGGDGTYRGAQALSQLGINTVGVPATIDNDIASTDFCIGFDTCLNTIDECVDKIRDTNASHQRCSFIEVMGNRCGDLGLYSGIAEGVEMIITPEHPMTEDEICSKLLTLRQGKKKHSLIIVSEKMIPDIHNFVKRVSEKTGIHCQAEVLGHLQRGGSPSAGDRILATQYGVAAVEALLDGMSGVCVGIKNGELSIFDINDALAMKRKLDKKILGLIRLVNR